MIGIASSEGVMSPTYRATVRVNYHADRAKLPHPNFPSRRRCLRIATFSGPID